MIDIDQYHRELRDTFNHDYRMLLVSNYMRLMGATLENAQEVVDSVLMMDRGVRDND